MKRRTFLAGLMAAPVAASMPGLPAPAGLQLAEVAVKLPASRNTILTVNEITRQAMIILAQAQRDVFSETRLDV
jgi:hypothetical protein